MKRLILAAILLFPVISLVIWFYWGANQRIRPAQSPSTNATPQAITNNSSAK